MAIIGLQQPLKSLKTLNGSHCLVTLRAVYKQSGSMMVMNFQRRVGSSTAVEGRSGLPMADLGPFGTDRDIYIFLKYQMTSLEVQ